MPREIVRVFHGTVIDDEDGLTLEELGRLCRLQQEAVIAMVDEGILEPEGERPGTWRFSGTCVAHARVAVRLQRDLGVNLAGAAVILELLERLNPK
jgi:chaperone modulatory protein CbpM